MNRDDQLARLLDEAVARLSTIRRTFTDEEALSQIWEEGYDLSPQSDPQTRFVLVAEADGKHRRQWRLHTQAVANDRLLDALHAGIWDGSELDTELARLSAQDSVYYIFCSVDARFAVLPDGRIELADREYNVALTAAFVLGVFGVGVRLITLWQSEGMEPSTVRQLTEKLGKLGWSAASERDGWLFVRAWLLEWPQVIRVGQDYWLPVDDIPAEAKRTRLQVLPVIPSTQVGETLHEQPIAPGAALSGADNQVSKIERGGLIAGKKLVAHQVSWRQPLRTIHLIEGFLPLPATARSVYPPRAEGEGEKQVLRGLWFENNERFWLWLDRANDRFYGPDLAGQLEWLEAGNILRIEWHVDGVVFRLTGHDENIQHEETRLVDRETLKALRGGLGETYRQSLQSILLEAPEGLTFKEIAQAMSMRQKHAVHRGTLRTLLYAGGFRHTHGRWFAALNAEFGSRTLRSALAQTLLPNEQATDISENMSASELPQKKLQAIRLRLSELVKDLREPMVNGKEDY